ncbi:DUF4247 domain-containing protein [Williamsia sp. DF01-3]|uniref:DUF4247 domain-containing protein n=1 Tax=Williamsia sp. DF01-3 TaxID=2934157 RepID=UPI001FF27CA0|nr:DUF4247 domain-containing protein [Williamsia sp. DF01-3]MCK0516502.1 DUF4247 domain-containing protein [Williamsia sp. DF01-3]
MTYDGDAGGYNRKPLNRIRNGIIAAIILVAVALLAFSCVSGGVASTSARSYIQQNYDRTPNLDEGSVDAYIADGTPEQVAGQIRGAQRPADQRQATQTVAGVPTSGLFMQYPDYLVGLFPYENNNTRVMLSDDYESGYRHYGGFIGGFWVSRPNFSGGGSDYRGGGGGSGK